MNINATNNQNAINVRMLQQVNQINELKGTVGALTLENCDLKDGINKLRNQLFEARKLISFKNASSLSNNDSNELTGIKENHVCDQLIDFDDDDDGFVRPSVPVSYGLVPMVDDEPPPKIQFRSRSNSDCPPPKPMSLLKSAHQPLIQDLPVQNSLERYRSLPSLIAPLGFERRRNGILKNDKIEFSEKKRVKFSYV